MYRFLSDVVVECVPYRSGDEVPADEIPAGSLDSLLRLRQVEAVPPAPATQPAEPVEPPKPAAKKAAKKAAKAAPVPSE